MGDRDNAGIGNLQTSAAIATGAAETADAAGAAVAALRIDQVAATVGRGHASLTPGATSTAETAVAAGATGYGLRDRQRRAAGDPDSRPAVAGITAISASASGTARAARCVQAVVAGGIATHAAVTRRSAVTAGPTGATGGLLRNREGSARDLHAGSAIAADATVATDVTGHAVAGGLIRHSRKRWCQ